MSAAYRSANHTVRLTHHQDSRYVAAQCTCAQQQTLCRGNLLKLDLWHDTPPHQLQVEIYCLVCKSEERRQGQESGCQIPSHRSPLISSLLTFSGPSEDPDPLLLVPVSLVCSSPIRWPLDESSLTAWLRSASSLESYNVFGQLPAWSNPHASILTITLEYSISILPLVVR